MGRKRKLAYVKRRTPQENAVINNHSTLFSYMRLMQAIATSMFEWKNLPTTMDERYLERSLFLYGSAALFWSDTYNAYINTNCTVNSKINIYGLPTEVNCHSFDFNESREVYNSPGAPGKEKGEECILVLNDREMLPTVSVVLLYAYRLTEAQRVADVNINAQRTPVTIMTNENQRLSVINAYQQFEENTPVIIGDRDNFDLSSIKVLKTDSPYVADKIMDYKQRIWNEFLTAIGVNNIERTKRERMISGETEQNNEVVNYNLQNFLLPRQKAANEFNEKYGLYGDKAVEVRVRSDLQNVIKQQNSIVNDFNVENPNE